MKFFLLMILLAFVIMACPSQERRARDGSKPSWNKLQKLCNYGENDSFRKEFNQIDCLITFYHTDPTHYKGLDLLVYKKVRALMKKLKKESDDWRTVARWKVLYRLVARLLPARNKRAQDSSIPIYEVNGHHLAVPFWIRESMKRKMGPLFHFDTHHDMRAVPTPDEVLSAVKDIKQGKNLKDAWHTIAHTVDDCAMPVTAGVLGVGFKRVVWAKPSWNGNIEFLNKTFFYGIPVPGVPVKVFPKETDPIKAKKQLQKQKELEKARSSFRLFYDWKDDGNEDQPLKGDAWISLVPKQRPNYVKFKMQKKFLFSILDADKTYTGKKADKKMQKQLLKAIPFGSFTLDLDLDYFASVDSDPEFKRKAGSDPDWKLKGFRKKRKILDARLARFRTLLLFLKRNQRIPSLITIADSTYMTYALGKLAEGQSEYTPIEHTLYLSEKVRDMFAEVYGKKKKLKGTDNK